MVDKGASTGMTKGTLFRVKPLLIGEFGPIRGDVKFRGGDPLEESMVPSYLFYLESAEKRIVVDTGFGPPEMFSQRAKLRCRSEGVLRVLERDGIDPESIDFVICTHLHWDHIGNVGVFRKAKIVCQRSELAWAFSPPPWEIGYERDFLRNIWEAANRVVAVDGRVVLLENLLLVKVGGHTPGSQVVEVNTSLGRVIIAGDLVMCFENLEKEWPIGLFWDLQECVEGIQWLKEQKALVLPSHDWKVLDMGLIG